MSTDNEGKLTAREALADWIIMVHEHIGIDGLRRVIDTEGRLLVALDREDDDE